MIGIYKITSPSGRVYIGQSIDIDRRQREYKNNKVENQRKLKNSFLKYGVTNHMFEVLQEFPDDILQEVLDRLEIIFIQQYRECGFKMMNIHPGGRGGKMPEETKKEISRARRGKHLSEEGLKNRREKLKNYRHSEETRKKMSEQRRKWKRSEESIRKTAEWHTGRKRNENTKKKLSECAKLVIRDDDYKRKMSESLKEYWKNNTNTFTCCKCGYQSNNKGVVQRWHNQNCKH